jgi:hypothetical protein
MDKLKTHVSILVMKGKTSSQIQQKLGRYLSYIMNNIANNFSNVGEINL